MTSAGAPDGRVLAGAAQQRPEPRDQLLDRERLDEVVVGARLQARDPVLHLIPGRQDEDRRADAVGPQAGADGTTVEVGHRHVEDDGGGRAPGDRLERRAAAGRRVHGEALEAQRALEGLTDCVVVVDDEDER